MARKTATKATDPEALPCEECGGPMVGPVCESWEHQKALRERALRCEGFVPSAYSEGVHEAALFALGLARFDVRGRKPGTRVEPVHISELEDVLTGDISDVLWAIGIRARTEALGGNGLLTSGEMILGFAVETYCRAQAALRIAEDVRAGMGLHVAKTRRMAESTRAIAKILAAHYPGGFPATFHRKAVRGVRGDNGSRIAVYVTLLDPEAKTLGFWVRASKNEHQSFLCSVREPLLTRYTDDRDRGFLGQLGWHLASEE